MPDYDFINNLATRAIQTAPNSSKSISSELPLTLGEAGGAAGISRYPVNFGSLDNENIYGRGQTSGDRWKNGALKFLATTGTTFVEGTAGLAYGIYKASSDGKFSSFYDNPLTRSLDKWKEEGLENSLPNYYTNKEKNAKWYSPDTWWTANFGSDLILKNAGFAVGAYLSGGAWTKGLGLVVKAVAGGEILGAGGKLAQAAARAEQSVLLSKNANTLSTYEQAALKAISTKYTSINNGLVLGTNIARAGIASVSEAGIEARHAKREYVDGLAEEFTKRNGYEPSDEIMESFSKLADDVGTATFIGNVALLSMTNYIQFPKLAGKFWSGERATLNGVERGIGRVGIANAEGKIVARSATRVLAPGESYVALKATTAIGNQMERVALGRALNRISPYARILASPSEGFEEGMQEVITRGSIDYYSSKQKGEDTDFYKSFKKAIKSTLNSKDGQLAIMSGLLTGGLMENIASPAMGGKFLHSVKKRNSLVQTAQKFVNDLNTNKIGNYMAEMNNSLKRANLIQEDQEQAVRNDDRLSYEDAETDAALNYLLPRVQYGRTELVQADIDAQRTLAYTDESFNEMKEKGFVPQDIDRYQYLRNLDNLESKLKTVEKHFENLNMRYGTLRDENGNQRYNMPHLLRMAYTGAKIDDYNYRIVSLYKNFNKYNISVMDVMQETLNEERSPKEVGASLRELSQEIRDKAGKENPELAQDMFLEASDIVELAYRRNQKVAEYERLRDQPEATPEHEMDLGMEEDPLENVPKAENLTEEEDGLLREIASKETNREEELTEEEKEFIKSNQEAYDKYVEEIVNKRPRQKETFYNENKDTEFFMEQGGEMKQGKLEYNPTTDRLSFNGREVTNQDINEGLLSSDQGINDTSDYLGTEDVRTRPLQSKRAIEVLGDALSKATKRQEEVQKKIEGHKEELRKANEQIDKAETEHRQRQKGVKSSAIASVTILTLQTLTNTRNTIVSEMENLTVENEDLNNLISQYKELIEVSPENLQSSISLLEKGIEQAEEAVLENGILNNKLSGILDSLHKSINRIKEFIINRLTAYTKFQPGDFVAKQALDSILESGENNVSPNFFAITKMLTGLDIAPAQAREAQTRKQLEEIASKLEDLENSIRAKQTALEELQTLSPMILNRVEVVENATEEEEEAYKDMEENTNEDPPDDSPTPPAAPKGEVFKDTEKKGVSHVYRSNSMPSVKQRSQDKNYKRWAYFLSKFRLFTDQDSYKTIYVTKNNEQAVFGTEGYIDQLYTDNEGNPYYQGDEATNGEDPAVAIVMVKEVVSDKGEVTLHFVDKLGRTKGKVGEEISLSEVIGWKMPSTSETYRNGVQARAYQDNKTSKNTLEQDLKIESEKWTKKRAEILSQTGIVNPESFTVSKGSITRGNIADSVRNDIVGTLINIKDIAKKGLLYIIKKKGQVVDGLKYKKGDVVVSGKDFNEKALNRFLDNTEADNIFNILKWLVKNRTSGESLLSPVMSYLQGLTYLGDTESKANFKFGEAFSFFSIDGVEHEMTEKYLEDNKQDILKQLLATKTNVNASLLEDNTSKFNEYYIDKEGKIQYTEWDNYQEFLLSPKTKDGKFNRSPSIKVNVVNGDESNPTFKDKYAILQPNDTARKDKAKTKAQQAVDLAKDSGLFQEEEVVVEDEEEIVTEEAVENTISDTAIATKPKTKKILTPTKKTVMLPPDGSYSGRVYNVFTGQQESLSKPMDYKVLTVLNKGESPLPISTTSGSRTEIRAEFPDETGAILQANVLVVRDKKTGKVYTIPRSTVRVKRGSPQTERGTIENLEVSDPVFTDDVDEIMEGQPISGTEVLATKSDLIVPTIKTVPISHSQKIKNKFREVFKRKGNKDAQIDAAIALMDARARSWVSEQAGRTLEQWFSRIADVREGNFQTTDIRYQESLEKSNAIFETRDGQPIGYNYDTNKVARERFDLSKLEQIGKGSDRTVFDLGNGQVLKVAHTPRGLAQNIYEGESYLSSIVPEVHERGLNYVVVDNVPRMKSSDIVPTYDESGEEDGTTTAGQMMRELKNFNQVHFDSHSSPLQDVLSKYGMIDIMSYSVLYGDFSAMRNWGYDTKTNMPVHIDGGTFGGVEMINEHKGQKPLSDSDFREIYNRSRQLKKEYQDQDRFTKFQDEKGALETLKDGKVIIHALKSHDVSTMVHEIFHIFEKDLTQEEKQQVKEFGGSEAFARAGERYLRNGEAPNKQLQPLFAKFKKWLTDIYNSLIGSPIEKEVSPEIKAIFDRLLVPLEIVTPEAVVPQIKPQAQQTKTEDGQETPKTENPTKPLAKKKKASLPEIGYEFKVEGSLYRVENYPDFGGFEVVEVLPNGEVAKNTFGNPFIFYINLKSSKQTIVHKGFLASQGIFESKTGPQLKCNK